MDASYAAGTGAVPGPPAGDLPARVRAARRDPGSVVLEGVHALKHAVRFGAELTLVVTPAPEEVARLLAALAPDVALPPGTSTVGDDVWRRLAPRGLPSPVLAVASRPPSRLAEALAGATGRLVVLEEPRHLGNLGAAVRTAAAADAAGLVVVGDADPWHPTAVRAAAGLPFALPVGRLDALPDTPRPLVAVDPGGAPLGEATLPPDAALLFGTERGGLSPALRRRAEQSVSVPMRPGVSSLNLATTVGIVLYGA